MLTERLRYMISFLLLLFLLCASRVEAREWTIMGPRALGMGGANVAVADDATASYWNPAAYGFFKSETGGDYGRRKWSTVADLGLGTQIHEDLGESLNRISKFDYDSLDNGQIPANKVADFIQLVNELKSFDENNNRAATVLVNGGLRVQVGHFGIGGYIFSDISAKGNLDLVNIAPVTSGVKFTLDDFTDPANYGCSPCTGGTYLTSAQKSELDAYLSGLGWNSTQRTNFINAVDYGLTQADSQGATIPSDIVTEIETVAKLGNAAAGSGGSFADNDSKLLFKGIVVMEFPITYGRAITEDFAIGGNIKYMKARVYNTTVKIFNTDFGDALDTAKDDYVDSSNFGIDLGLLYRFGDDLRIGVVGRNLNSPKFDMKQLLPGDSDQIEEKPQIRAGIAYKPLSFLMLALDVDLTRNDTTVSGDYKSQNIGGGLELNIFKILQLRAGAYKNLAEDDIGLVYTAGAGLNLWLLNLDIGASFASETSELDGNNIPKEAKVELALSMLF